MIYKTFYYSMHTTKTIPMFLKKIIKKKNLQKKGPHCTCKTHVMRLVYF